MLGTGGSEFADPMYSERRTGPETATGQASRCAGAVYLGIVAAGDAVGRGRGLPPSVWPQWHCKALWFPRVGCRFDNPCYISHCQHNAIFIVATLDGKTTL